MSDQAMEWFIKLGGTLTAAAIVAIATNLWTINQKLNVFGVHHEQWNADNATLPGALSRVEFDLEKEILDQRIQQGSTTMTQLRVDIEQMKIEIRNLEMRL